MSTTRHSRWKYAEEHAYRLIRADRLISITMEPDVVHVEGPTPDDVYIYDEFFVHDLGPR